MAGASSSLFEICDVPGRGRGLFATHDIEPGELIFEREPYAAVLDTHLLSEQCSGCFQQSSTDPMLSSISVSLKQCAGCKIIWHCLKTCQKKDWIEFHKLECKILVSALEKWYVILPHFCLCVLVFIRKSLYPSASSFIHCLFEHPESSESIPTLSTMELSYSLKHLLPTTLLPDNDQAFAHAIEKIDKNRYSLINDIDGADIGSAVYLEPLSLLNHFCLPNVWEPNVRLMKRVVTGQCIQKGDEFLASFVPVTYSMKRRHATLMELHGISCNCDQTIYRFAQDPREAWVCPFQCTLKTFSFDHDLDIPGMAFFAINDASKVKSHTSKILACLNCGKSMEISQTVFDAVEKVLKDVDLEFNNQTHIVQPIHQISRKSTLAFLSKYLHPVHWALYKIASIYFLELVSNLPFNLSMVNTKQLLWKGEYTAVGSTY